MSKYYTPDPSELHIGQEFEFRNRHNSKEWVALKDRHHGDLIITLENYFNNEYRIKKLDEEDIVSLGWDKNSTIFLFPVFYNKNWQLTLWPDTVEIANREKEEKFHAEIKCKFDLQTLMRFLNIPLPENKLLSSFKSHKSGQK